jgi:uncharacterized protein YegP (UPF0339 family)
MAARFQIKRSLKGDYFFVLVSPNGRTLATGEDYKTKSGVVGAIKAVRDNAAGAEVEDQSTKEYLAQEAAKKPAAKAARAIGKAMGKAKAALEDALSEPTPPPPPARRRAPAKQGTTRRK